MLNKPKLYSTTELYREANVRTPRLLYLNAVLNTAYKLKSFTIVSHCHETRYISKGPYCVPKPNKSIFLRSFSFIGPKLCSLLPLEIENINNLGLYKKKSKLWLNENKDVIYHCFPFLQLHFDISISLSVVLLFLSAIFRVIMQS